jgi:hypothetical protein
MQHFVPVTDHGGLPRGNPLSVALRLRSRRRAEASGPMKRALSLGDQWIGRHLQPLHPLNGSGGACFSSFDRRQGTA